MSAQELKGEPVQADKKQKILEALAIGSAALIIFGLSWFWVLQIGDVSELLKLAAGG